MTGIGIYPKSLLVVDRSIKPTHGRIVVAVVDGELTVKRLNRLRGGGLELVAENPEFPPLRFTEGQEVVVWGVVTAVVQHV